eukprot:354917-Chlamydomonas_euryale.AAC.28
MGLGAVTHTVNPRLSDKDIRFIVNDAKDCMLLSDITFAETVRTALRHHICRHSAMPLHAYPKAWGRRMFDKVSSSIRASAR